MTKCHPLLFMNAWNFKKNFQCIYPYKYSDNMSTENQWYVCNIEQKCKEHSFYYMFAVDKICQKTNFCKFPLNPIDFWTQNEIQ